MAMAQLGEHDAVMQEMLALQGRLQELGMMLAATAAAGPTITVSSVVVTIVRSWAGTWEPAVL